MLNFVNKPIQRFFSIVVCFLMLTVAFSSFGMKCPKLLLPIGRFLTGASSNQMFFPPREALFSETIGANHSSENLGKFDTPNFREAFTHGRFFETVYILTHPVIDNVPSSIAKVVAVLDNAPADAPRLLLWNSRIVSDPKVPAELASRVTIIHHSSGGELQSIYINAKEIHLLGGNLGDSYHSPGCLNTTITDLAVQFGKSRRKRSLRIVVHLSGSYLGLHMGLENKPIKNFVSAIMGDSEMILTPSAENPDSTFNFRNRMPRPEDPKVSIEFGR